MWGIFDETEDVHVVPCQDSGEMKPCHILQRDCWCSPIVEIKNGQRPMVIHQDEN